ncbi:hypothetical protein ACFL1H_00245 [Nanoarchaeota archaeon]
MKYWILILLLIVGCGQTVVVQDNDNINPAIEQKFMNDLNYDLEKVALTFDYKIINYNVPKSIEKVCFIDLDKANDEYPIFNDKHNLEQGYNVYIQRNGAILPYLNINTKIVNEKEFVNCIFVIDRQLKLELEGRGNKVYVKGTD